MNMPAYTYIHPLYIFFFSSRRRHTRLQGDWSSDVCSSDLFLIQNQVAEATAQHREAQAIYLTVAQNIRLQIQDSFLDVVTLIQQIKVAEQQVIIAREALSLADRKSTRLNSSHLVISYAVFC